MSFFENTRKPAGLGGKAMLAMMNLGHRSLAEWGLSFLPPSADAAVLDCGCGGGANIQALLNRYPNGHVSGIDYSSVSVEASRTRNQKAIAAGRCEITQASVEQLPFADRTFDLITAFETVYFWPGPAHCFEEIFRVLKPGGTFLICNECSGNTPKDDKWTKIVSGMTIYRGTQLQAALRQAGFCRIELHKHKAGWLCLTAQA